MKTVKYSFLRYHLCEYKILEAYFEQMSEQGWMLCGRLAMFDDIFRFEKAQVCKRKFHVVLNPQVHKVNTAYDKVEQKKYIDFVQSYGYQLICDDYDILIFYSDDIHAIEINEDNKEVQSQIRKYTRMNELLYPILYTVLISVSLYLTFFETGTWIMMTYAKLLLLLMSLLYMVSSIYRACIASVYMLFPKRKHHINNIRRRSKMMLCVYALFQVVLCTLLSMQTWWFGILFVFVEIVFVYIIKRIWKYKYIPRELVGLAVLITTYVLLLFYSSNTQKQLLPVSEIPFRSQELQGVTYNTTLVFLEKEDHMFLTSYRVDENYYDEINGGIHDDQHQFSYTYYVLKDTLFKQPVIETLLSEVHADYRNDVNGMKVYDVGDLQFYIKNDIILMLSKRIPLNDVNIKLFENVFSLESKGERK